MTTATKYKNLYIILTVHAWKYYIITYANNLFPLLRTTVGTPHSSFFVWVDWRWAGVLTIVVVLCNTSKEILQKCVEGAQKMLPIHQCISLQAKRQSDNVVERDRAEREREREKILVKGTCGETERTGWQWQDKATNVKESTIEFTIFEIMSKNCKAKIFLTDWCSLKNVLFIIVSYTHARTHTPLKLTHISCVCVCVCTI